MGAVSWDNDRGAVPSTAVPTIGSRSWYLFQLNPLRNMRQNFITVLGEFFSLETKR